MTITKAATVKSEVITETVESMQPMEATMQASPMLAGAAPTPAMEIDEGRLPLVASSGMMHRAVVTHGMNPQDVDVTKVFPRQTSKAKDEKSLGLEQLNFEYRSEALTKFIDKKNEPLFK